MQVVALWGLKILIAGLESFIISLTLNMCLVHIDITVHVVIISYLFLTNKKGTWRI